jgi:hypothetical protein
MKTYKIIRFYRDSDKREVIETGLTYEEAMDHCNDPDTSNSEEGWFDGKEVEYDDEEDEE